MSAFTKTLKNILKGFVARMPGSHLVARLAYQRVRPDTLTILMYHHVLAESLPVPDWTIISRDNFYAQMHYLKANFEVVSLAEGVHRLRQGARRARTVAITFDDGYQDNFTNAFPILQELRLPATIYLSTAFVGTGQSIWAGRLLEALCATNRPDLVWHGRKMGLGTAQQKQTALSIWATDLKRLPHEALTVELDSLVRQLGGDTSQPLSPKSPFRMLDRGSIHTMADSGLISFGAHTHHHAILRHLSEGEQRFQICRSVKAVQELTGRECYDFAYPNGGRDDFTPLTVDIVRQCGIRQAVTTIGGYNDGRAFPLALARVGVGGDWNVAFFRLALHLGL